MYSTQHSTVSWCVKIIVSQVHICFHLCLVAHCRKWFELCRLSALNVEELRQEHGMEALKTVSAQFAACMHGQVDRDAGAGEWWRTFAVWCTTNTSHQYPGEQKKLFVVKLLQMLCFSVAVECVSSLAMNSILQIHFLQSGVLWHLLMTLSQWCKTQWTPSGMRCSTLPLPGSGYSGCTTRFGLQQASVIQNVLASGFPRTP